MNAGRIQIVLPLAVALLATNYFSAHVSAQRGPQQVSPVAPRQEVVAVVVEEA